MKKIIRNLFNKLGYDFIKLKDFKSNNPNKKEKVKIGNFILDIPSNNPLAKHYQYHPNYNIHLGQLSQIVFTKYPDLTVLDIGANIGDTIAVIKSITNVPIIAIEGDSNSYKNLQENSKLFDEVIIVNNFLGEKNEDIKMSIQNEGWNNTLIPSTKGEKIVALKTLDSILEKENFSNSKCLKLLKIDAEGFDTIILRGSITTIKKFNPVLYFEYNRSSMDVINEDGLQTLFSFLEYGYNNIIFLDDHSRCLLKTTLKEKEIVEQLHNYADGINGLIPHFDICIFHNDDEDIFNAFFKIVNNK